MVSQSGALSRRTQIRELICAPPRGSLHQQHIEHLPLLVYGLSTVMKLLCNTYSKRVAHYIINQSSARDNDSFSAVTPEMLLKVDTSATCYVAQATFVPTVVVIGRALKPYDASRRKAPCLRAVHY
jgi:hypothetical protein